MSYHQQQYNTFQQGGQVYGQYQMGGQIQQNQQQQIYNNSMNQQQQQDDFGDFVSSNPTNQQTTQAQSNKYDAFSNLTGASGFSLNESTQKPPQKQGVGQNTINTIGVNNNQYNNMQFNASIQGNTQNGYGNYYQQQGQAQNMQQQLYQQGQLQNQQMYQQQLRQQQMNLPIQQQNYIGQQHQYGNQQQTNQFYGQQQILQPNQNQGQFHINQQALHQNNDQFGDFSTASTQPQVHHLQGQIPQNFQPHQQHMHGQQNVQQQVLQQQNNQQNLAQLKKQKDIDDAFGNLINVVLPGHQTKKVEQDEFGEFSTAQSTNQQINQLNYHQQQQHQYMQQIHQNQMQSNVTFQNTQLQQQKQKESDDFGDFADAPTITTAVHNNQNIQTIQQAFNNNINTIPNQQVHQTSLMQQKQQSPNRELDDDFGDFTSNNQNGVAHQQISIQNAFNNIQNLQNNQISHQQQQQQQSVNKQSDDFGDFSTASHQPIQQNNPQPLLNNLQTIQNAFATLQPQSTQQNQQGSANKTGDDFGDFETASVQPPLQQNNVTIQNAFGGIQLPSTYNQQNNQQSSSKGSDDFGEFSEAQSSTQVHQQQQNNQVRQNNIQGDLFEDIVEESNQGNNQKNIQKVSDDFGDFQDTSAPKQQQSFVQAVVEGPKKYDIFYELEKQTQIQQPQKSVLDMPIEQMTVQQPSQTQNQQKNLFEEEDEDEDDFGDFQETGADNKAQQQQQQQLQQHHNLQFSQVQQQQHKTQNEGYHAYSLSQSTIPAQNTFFVPSLPVVNKTGEQIEKDLIGNVISLFDDYKVDHLTDTHQNHHHHASKSEQVIPSHHIPQQNIQHQNKVVEEDEFGDFAEFQDSKQQQPTSEKVIQHPIHAYELDWDQIIKQNQQVTNDLQPNESLQDELQQQTQQESQLNTFNKKNHQHNLFEENSSQNNNNAASSIQDQNQSQPDTFTLEFDKQKQQKKNQKQKDFEDELQGDVAADEDFGDFETSNLPQPLNQNQISYPIYQAQNHNNTVNKPNDDLLDDFEITVNPPPQQNLINSHVGQNIVNQNNSNNGEDLFGDFQDNPNPLVQQQQNQIVNNINDDDFGDFDDFESAPTQQQQQQPPVQNPIQQVKVMDLKEFEMNTFDITALDYGEGAKQKVEQQRREQERKKQDEEERQKRLKQQQEQMKQDRLNAIPQFKVGKQLYRGEYWRKVFEGEENYYLDNKFYEDLIQEIDSLGFYQHFEKLISIREGLEKIDGLEKQRKKAKDDGNYDRVYQLKQEITQLEEIRDYKAEIVSLVYQITACDGKCFNHLLYDRLINLDNALLFVKQFQALHDQNRDLDELIDFIIICTTIDTNYTSYTYKLYQVQEVCEKELQSFENQMNTFNQLSTQVKQQIVEQKQFQDYIKANSQILYHGKRYSKISASLNSQLINFENLEKMITNHIQLLNKQFNTQFESIKKNFSFTEELTQDQREKLINDIVNGESNLNLTEFICNLCLGVANETKVHYRAKHYHNLCINIWFNKISTIIE